MLAIAVLIIKLKSIIKYIKKKHETQQVKIIFFIKKQQWCAHYHNQHLDLGQLRVRLVADHKRRLWYAKKMNTAKLQNN